MHYRTWVIALIVAAAPFAAAAPLQAASINYTVNSISPFTYSADAFFGTDSRSNTLLVSDSAFTADFGSLGTTTLTVTFNFPQPLEVIPPTGFSDVHLWFRSSFDPTTFNSFSDSSPNVTITGNAAAEALTPGWSNSKFDQNGDPNLTQEFRLDLLTGQTYRFDSLTMTTTIPSAYSGVFFNEFADHARLGIEAYDFAEVADPGTWATLTTAEVVPVPGAALAGLALASVISLRRRRGIRQ